MLKKPCGKRTEKERRDEYFGPGRRLAAICFAAAVLFLVFAPHQDVLTTDPLCTFQEFSAEHLLGTDNLGRDLYALMVEGGLRTLLVIVLSSAISCTAGTALGILAAYSRGVLRSAIQMLADFTLIIPSFVMALIFSAVFGFRPVTAGLVFGIGNMGEYVNQARELTESMKNRGFIEGELLLGVRKGRLIFCHILPNIGSQLMTYLGNKAGSVTIQYAGLAFIGLGTDVTAPDWGTLLYQYRTYLLTYPRLVLAPAIAICLLAVFFHVMFDTGGAKEELTVFD